MVNWLEKDYLVVVQCDIVKRLPEKRRQEGQYRS
jgi:hypothetical protein